MSAEGDRLRYWGGSGRAAQGLGFADSVFLEFGIAREPCKSWDDGGWNDADVWFTDSYFWKAVRSANLVNRGATVGGRL